MSWPITVAMGTAHGSVLILIAIVLAGPALGGLIVALVGSATGFAIDAVTLAL